MAFENTARLTDWDCNPSMPKCNKEAMRRDDTTSWGRFENIDVCGVMRKEAAHLGFLYGKAAALHSEVCVMLTNCGEGLGQGT